MHFRTFVLIGVARIIQDSSSILVTKNNWFPAIMLFPREQLSQIPNRRWTFILCECLHLFINCLCHLFRSASFIWQLLYIRQCDNKPMAALYMFTTCTELLHSGWYVIWGHSHSKFSRPQTKDSGSMSVILAYSWLRLYLHLIFIQTSSGQ